MITPNNPSTRPGRAAYIKAARGVVSDVLVELLKTQKAHFDLS
jgi:hypothetical protein